jgi:hypothetical protein
MGQGEVQRESGPERITEDVDGVAPALRSNRLGDEVGPLPQVGPHLARAAVAGQVNEEKRSAFGQARAEIAEESPRLGEAVQQDTGPTFLGADALGLQRGHVR